jgi:uncharacterized membrane protein YhaH (DUF805 family)
MDLNNWKQALFSASGRMRRSHFWLWTVIVMVATQVVLQLILALTNSTQVLMQTGTMPLPAILAYIVITPLQLWIGVCLSVKRWHDRDKSGWMYLIILIPIVGVIWWFVEVGCLDGTQGSNKYGPSPKGIGGSADVF